MLENLKHGVILSSDGDSAVMKTEKQPTCYIVAGPNGAGKTTIALQYLPKIVSCNNFINADEIAKGVSPLDFEAGLLQASKIFLKTLNQKIQKMSRQELQD